jgi:hypothetical protein
MVLGDLCAVPTFFLRVTQSGVVLYPIVFPHCYFFFICRVHGLCSSMLQLVHLPFEFDLLFHQTLKHLQQVRVRMARCLAKMGAPVMGKRFSPLPP